MKFPGSKLLHHWDLETQRLSLDDLLRSCQQVGLTGFAEVKFPEAVGMIFYYLGGEVNALYREGAVAYHGQAALERLRAQVTGDEGVISVYELPLDMAHLLRGHHQPPEAPRDPRRARRTWSSCSTAWRRPSTRGPSRSRRTPGSAMMLLVRGRVSNIYWETSGGLTFEKGEARQKLEEALGKDEAQIFLSEFSRDIWKTRHEVQASVRSRLERREEAAPASRRTRWRPRRRRSATRSWRS